MTDKYHDLREAISNAEYSDDAYWLDRYRGEFGPDTIRGLLAERDALQAECEKLRNGLKNARYRIEQGRIWNGMGWSLTGLHAYQQQRALDEIDAAIQGGQL